jgi:hypothetical protein
MFSVSGPGQTGSDIKRPLKTTKECKVDMINLCAWNAAIPELGRCSRASFVTVSPGSVLQGAAMQPHGGFDPVLQLVCSSRDPKGLT